MSAPVKSISLAAAGALCLAAAPAVAQHTEGDALSRLGQYARMNAAPGTFWLDGNEDREIIRYTSPRDVQLCLPRPSGIGAAEQGYAVRVTWDGASEAILYPGNCLFFDASRVSLSPAEDIPDDVTIQGRVEIESALNR